MKKRGFTLVEMIAVITILALILVIAVPAVMRSRDTALKGLNKEEIRNIKEAGKNLGIDLDDYNTDIYNCKKGAWIRNKCSKENNKWKKVVVTIDDLRDHGYLTDETSKWDGKVIVETLGDGSDYSVILDEKGETKDISTEEIIVTFNANGGTVSETSRVLMSGENYGELPIPTRVGYKFKGWFTSTTDETEVTRKSLVKEGNHTLYAHWE